VSGEYSCRIEFAIRARTAGAWSGASEPRFRSYARRPVHSASYCRRTEKQRHLRIAGRRPHSRRNESAARNQRLRTETPILIGVISDTHGLLRPEALLALRGSEHIIHAGDVGAPEILEKLADLAPLTAIAGNVDKGAWLVNLRKMKSSRSSAFPFYVVHDLAQLELKPEPQDSKL